MLDLISLRTILICFLSVYLASLGKSSHAHIFDQGPQPSTIEIDLTRAGPVADFRFKVKKHFSHWFSMRFWFAENDQAERARIQKLLGSHAIDKNGKPAEPGISTPVDLQIFAECAGGKEVEVYSQHIDPILASWGAGYFGKNIGHHILTPGVYRARLVNKRAAHELSSIRTTFEIAMPANVVFTPGNTTSRGEPCRP